MKRITIGRLLAGLVIAVTTGTTQATGGAFFSKEHPRRYFPPRERSFQRVGTLANYLSNGDDGGDETVSEIVAANRRRR
jgi:hypothetical protein